MHEVKNAYLFAAVGGVVILGGLWMLARRPVPMLQDPPVSFFVTSENPGKGGNLGGLAGADAYCQDLAQEVGLGNQTWRAYLSGKDANGNIVNARDRIGSGPWYNVKGEMIASSVEDLHAPTSNLNKATALSEVGIGVLGRGDERNDHDILTGSNPDGTASSTKIDTTCANWTSSAKGSAIVGHHDRKGLDESDSAKSWNSSHLSRGCSMENLRATGGAGLVYCFAVSGR